jgi:transcriptional regulator with PAS, ATPase and Fis domain
MILRVVFSHSIKKVRNLSAKGRSSIWKALLEEKSGRIRQRVTFDGDRMRADRAFIKEGLSVIEKAARCDKNVLILGETGTGKDMAARKVHDLSSRREEPFVALNCASLPEELVEAELFGYARGAFTSAFREKEGLLESAGTGTVFLDEIAELPFRLQAKLLRLIDKKEVRRIGETFIRSVSARFIFATNKILHEEVNAGRFRRDLYFRINVICIWLPPLRERREEIPLLAHHFLERENLRGSAKKDLSPETLKKLMAYDFPGNIRELENIIERAFVLCEDKIIKANDLRFEGENTEGNPMGGITPEILRRVLSTCHWNKTRAANEIGKSRRQLYRLIEKYGMDDCIRKAVFL